MISKKQAIKIIQDSLIKQSDIESDKLILISNIIGELISNNIDDSEWAGALKKKYDNYELTEDPTTCNEIISKKKAVEIIESCFIHADAKHHENDNTFILECALKYIINDLIDMEEWRGIITRDYCKEKIKALSVLR